MGIEGLEQFKCGGCGHNKFKVFATIPDGSYVIEVGEKRYAVTMQSVLEAVLDKIIGGELC